MGLCVPSDVADMVRKTSDGIHSEGLVHVRDSADFTKWLESLKDQWDERELCL